MFCEAFPLAFTLGTPPTKLMEGDLLGNLDFPPTSNISPQVDRQGKNSFDPGNWCLWLVSHVFLQTFIMVKAYLAKYKGKLLECEFPP